MSANNFVLVKKNHKGTAYGVQECDADTGSEIEFIGTMGTLEEAIRMANYHIENNEVEYGLKVEV